MQIKEKGLSILRMLAVFLLVYLPIVIIPRFLLMGFVSVVFGSPESVPKSVITIINIVYYIIPVLLALLACFIISKIYKVKMQEFGMFFTKNWIRNFGIGIGVGTLSVTTVWLLSLLLGGYSIAINNLNQSVLIAISVNLLCMLMVGYMEEVVTRGLMTFVGVKNNKLFNAISVGILFASIHLLRPSFDIFSMINTILIGILFSMLTWISGDLWVAIGYHVFWNFILGSIFGVPVSGGSSESSFLISSPTSSGLINGGGYGLEASLLNTIFILIQISFIYVFFIKKGKINKEPSSPWLA